MLALLFPASTLGLAMPAQAADDGHTAICQSFVQKYRDMLASAPASGERFYPEDVLGNLSKAASTGVTLASSLINKVEPDKLTDWAKNEDPSFSIPPALIASIKENTHNSQWLDRLPGTNLYAVNGTAGSDGCYQSGVYFKTEAGQAVAVDGPGNWSDAACMVTRRFGTIDETPVAFQAHDWEIGTHQFTLTPWQGSEFGTDCTVTFAFTQKFTAFDPSNSDVPADECTGAACEGLKKASWDLVRDVQANSQGLLGWAADKSHQLTPAQNQEFEAIMSAVSSAGVASLQSIAGPDVDMVTADDASVDFPLVFPLVVSGKTYLAEIRHHQVRPHMLLPGWQVTIHHLTDGQLDEADKAVFQIGMQGDTLADATIK